MRIAREVYSDNNFNLERCCVRCGKLVARIELGKAVAPILAIGPLTASGALDDAATLCSACVGAIGFQLCYQVAAARVDTPRDLRCIYQVVGSPGEQGMIEELVEALDRSIAT